MNYGQYYGKEEQRKKLELTIEEVFVEGTLTEVPEREYKENLFIFLNAHNRYLQEDDEAEYWNAVNPLNPKAAPITKESSEERGSDACSSSSLYFPFCFCPVEIGGAGTESNL